MQRKCVGKVFTSPFVSLLHLPKSYKSLWYLVIQDSLQATQAQQQPEHTEHEGNGISTEDVAQFCVPVGQMGCIHGCTLAFPGVCLFVCLLACLLACLVVCLFVCLFVSVTSLASDLPFHLLRSPGESNQGPSISSYFQTCLRLSVRKIWLQDWVVWASILQLRRLDPPETKTFWGENSRVENSSSSRRSGVCF